MVGKFQWFQISVIIAPLSKFTQARFHLYINGPSELWWALLYKPKYLFLEAKRLLIDSARGKCGLCCCLFDKCKQTPTHPKIMWYQEKGFLRERLRKPQSNLCCVSRMRGNFDLCLNSWMCPAFIYIQVSSQVVC